MVSILLWLLNAWILGLFGFDTMFIQGMHEIFNLNISQAGYYTFFVFVSLLKGFSYNIAGSLSSKLNNVKKENNNV